MLTNNNLYEWFPEKKIKKYKNEFFTSTCIQHTSCISFQKNLLTQPFILCSVTLTNQHRYKTHNNYRMTLEQVRAGITSIQEKMDQLLKTMMVIDQRERVAKIEVGAKRIASQVGTLGLVNQDDNFTRAK